MNPFKNQCPHCTFCANNKSVLQMHLKNFHEKKRRQPKSQEGQRNYNCDSCGKSFTRSDHLKTHIKTVHEDQRNFNCSFCGKSFNTPQNLKQHIKTLHEGERNYKCDSCGKSFTTSAYLKFHINTVHVMQRNFKWYSCKKIFSFIAKSEKSCT